MLVEGEDTIRRLREITGNESQVRRAVGAFRKAGLGTFEEDPIVLTKKGLRHPTVVEREYGEALDVTVEGLVKMRGEISGINNNRLRTGILDTAAEMVAEALAAKRMTDQRKQV